MQYVDGTRSIPEIVRQVREHIEKGELTIEKDGVVGEVDNPEFSSILDEYTLNHLGHFALNALLMKTGRS